MADPSVKWRVNRHPRFSVLEMGEYMAADDGPRETMLRHMRFERLARSLTYRNLNRAVRSFLASPTRDRRILAQCRIDLEHAKAGATSPQQRENYAYELRALDTFERSLNALELGNFNMEMAGPAAPLRIEGVAVSVQPTAHIRASRPRGADLVGAVVIDLAKGTEPKTEEAKYRVRSGMEHAAILVHQYVTGHFGTDGVKSSPEHCIIFHTHRQDRVCAPDNYRRAMNNIEAVCRNIARSWDGVAPPLNFDERFAIYRN